MGERIDGRTLRYRHRRGELLEAVAEYVLDNGVASLSLRRLADAVGVSHVTLQHHFGSKEQLVGEIVEHLLERSFTPERIYPEEPIPGIDLPARWRALWRHLSSSRGQRDVRLFVEVLGQSQFHGAGYAPAVKRSINRRLELIATNLLALGCPAQDAQVFATLTLAMLRGLMIDRLATGEHSRVDDTFDRALEAALSHATTWEGSARMAVLAEGEHTG